MREVGHPPTVEGDPLGSKVFNWLPHDARRRAAAVVKRDRFRRYQALRTSTVGDGYTLEGFDRLRTVFVHIPKAAGISVAEGLFGNKGGGHIPISAYRIIYSKAEFESYFKFAFVRDPWNRLLSAYTFLAGGGMNDDDRAWWTNNHLDRFASFDDFVRGWLTRENAATSLHFLPQHRYLCLPGTLELAVDFVGRYESLDRDYAAVRARLGLPPAPLPRLNFAQKSVRSAKCYTAETWRIVSDVYAEDAALFRYP